MRWSEDGFNHLLHLRLAWVNGSFARGEARVGVKQQGQFRFCRAPAGGIAGKLFAQPVGHFLSGFELTGECGGSAQFGRPHLQFRQ